MQARKNVRGLVALVLVGLALFAVGGAAAAMEQRPYPVHRAHVHISSGSGQHRHVSGSGFAPGSNVAVYVTDSSGRRHFIGNFHVGPNGRFEGDVRLPGSLPPGSYTLVVRGTAPGGGSIVATDGFVIGSRARFVSDSLLPDTGAPLLIGAALGGTALIGGAAIVLFSRSRNKA